MTPATIHLPKFIHQFARDILLDIPYPTFPLTELFTIPELGEQIKQRLRVDVHARGIYAGLYVKTSEVDKATGEVSKRKAQSMLKLGVPVDDKGQVVQKLEDAKGIVMSFPSWMVKSINSLTPWEPETVDVVLKDSDDKQIIVRESDQKLYTHLQTMITQRRASYFKQFMTSLRQSQADKLETNIVYPGILMLAGLLDEYGTRAAILKAVSVEYGNYLVDIACYCLLEEKGVMSDSRTRSAIYSRLSEKSIDSSSWSTLADLYNKSRPNLKQVNGNVIKVERNTNETLEDFFDSLVNERQAFDSTSSLISLENEYVNVDSTDLDTDGKACDDISSYMKESNGNDFILGVRLTIARAQESGQTVAMRIDSGKTVDASVFKEICEKVFAFNLNIGTLIADRAYFDISVITLLISYRISFLLFAKAQNIEMKEIAFKGQLALSYGGFDSTETRIKGAKSVGQYQKVNLTQAGFTNEFGWPTCLLGKAVRSKHLELSKMDVNQFLELNKVPSWSRFQPAPSECEDSALVELVTKYQDKSLSNFIELAQAENSNYSVGQLNEMRKLLDRKLDPATEVAVMTVCDPDKYLSAHKAILNEADKVIEYITERRGRFSRKEESWTKDFSPLARKLVSINWEAPADKIPRAIKKDLQKLADYVALQYANGNTTRVNKEAKHEPADFWVFISADCQGVKVDSLFRKANAKAMVHYSPKGLMSEAEMRKAYSGRDKIEKDFDFDKNDLEFKSVRVHSKQTLAQKGIVFGIIHQIKANLKARIDRLVKNGDLSADWNTMKVLRNLKDIKVEVFEGTSARLVLISADQKKALKVMGWDNIWNDRERMADFLNFLNDQKPLLDVPVNQVNIRTAKMSVD